MSSACRRAACLAAGAVLVLVAASPARAAAAPSPSGGWQRPVSGAVVRPFEQPRSVYGPGHRGVDFAAPPGTPVRAANDGVVTFAGSVAGTLHVTIAHAGNLRTSYSFLQSLAVHEGQTVARGEVIATSGGRGDEHDGSVLHLGLRVGDRYVDPMLLFDIDDLTKIVHLVPADGPDEAPWTSMDERRELQASLHLPMPSGALGSGAPGTTGEGSGCGGGIPILGAAVSAVCDVGGWLGGRAEDALDAGLAVVDAITNVASTVLDELRAPLHELVATLRELPGKVAESVARTPMGQVALGLVEMGRRFADTFFAECSDDAPSADGTGGSAHRVMVVAGINSSGAAGDRGPTVALDVAALGYHPAEGEVRYYSYGRDGGPYDARDTRGDLPAAASQLAEQLRTMQREQPGREVDLIAHSQGGVVVDLFLTNYYHASDPTLPPLGTVVTLSSPHEGAPLATAASQIRKAPVGKAALSAVGNLLPSIPDPNAQSVAQLAQTSRTIRGIQRAGVPEHVDFTSIGATEDAVVPATNISLRGAAETTVAVNSVSEHSAIVRDPSALRAVRAALEGRAPPCVGLDTALRGAVAPVVIRRASNLGGDLLSGAVGAVAVP